MTNKNNNVLLGLVYVLIFVALIYFVFLRKRSKSCKSSADCLKGGYMGLTCQNGKCVPLGPNLSGFGSTNYPCPGGYPCTDGPNCTAVVIPMGAILQYRAGQFNVQVEGRYFTNQKIINIMKYYSGIGYKFAIVYPLGEPGIVNYISAVRKLFDTVGYNYSNDFFTLNQEGPFLYGKTIGNPQSLPYNDNANVIDIVQCYYGIKNRDRVIIVHGNLSDAYLR